MTKMASAWSVAFKKRRMMIDIGLDVSENKPLPADEPRPSCTTSFPYSPRKIDWPRNHFGENFRMPSRCAVHKAAADAERDKDRSGSPPENPFPENPAPAVPAKSRFGSRRTPNVDQ
jgi:hypothetical protein